MRKCTVVPVALVVAVAAQFAWVGKSFAIPAFSRQHKTECTTCHTIYPELNEYGEAFRKNGYVWIGKHAAETDKRMPEEVRGGGDDAEQLERLKGQAAVASRQGGDDRKAGESRGKRNEGLWLAAIPELIPISFTASMDLAYSEHPANNDKLDLSTRSLVLNGGGAFRDVAGFFITYNAYTQGLYDPLSANVPDSNRPDISELFLIGHHIFGTPINVKIGRFQPQLRDQSLSLIDQIRHLQ